MSATTFEKTADRLRGISGEQLSPRELGAWRGFLRVHSALTKRLDADLLAEHGLALSSYEVLLTLESAPKGGVRMSEVASSALLSRSGLTRLVDRLVRDALVERRSCPSDLRGSNAVITELGRERLAAARKTHLAGVREGFLARFGDAELDALAGFWDRLEPGAAETGSGPDSPSC